LKKNLADLAIFGGERSSNTVMPVGQFNFPEWERIENMCEGVFERHYFTNHGVLAQALEKKLCSYLNVRNAVTLTNESISIMYVATALGLNGKVVVPALAPPSTVQSLIWCGLEPVFCDVDSDTFLVTPDLVRSVLEQQTVSAVLATHLWGEVCDTVGFDRLAEEYDIPVFYDASHAFGCSADNEHTIGGNGSAEILSFNASNVLNAGEGGVVATDDDDLAEKLRNLRSSYGRLENVDIPVNGDGRFSELQAGLALLSLEDLEKNIESNRSRKLRYREGLKSIEGVETLFDDVETKGNHQWIVVRITEADFGMGRNELADVMLAENIRLEKPCANGAYNFLFHADLYMPVLPVAESAFNNVLLLPSGEEVTLEFVDLICSIISIAHLNAKKITNKLNDV
jgi:dTDP-4-amino-4,6-dideoxygalactose transaminase